MAYYKTCPRCGANLDPGEKCDCAREKERFSSYIKKNTNTGQYTFCLEKKHENYRSSKKAGKCPVVLQNHRAKNAKCIKYIYK